MKKCFLLIFLIVSSISYSQVKSKELETKKTGLITCFYNKMVNVVKEDTSFYVSLKFQNAKYSSITDTRSINFFSNEDLNEFLKDLKNSINEIGEKTDVIWTKKNYQIAVLKNSNDISISESERDGGGYVFIRKKEAEKIIEWSKNIVIGYEFLNK